MSKLDDLIKKLCPNGVEFHSVEDVADVARGIRVVRSQLADQGSYPVFQNSLTPMGYYEKQNCKADTTFVIAAGAAGEIGYSYSDFWAADDCYFFKCSKALSSRYLYHMLLWKQPFLKSRVRKASIPRLSRDHIEQLSIPVPPLPVQEEIVRILDSFTKLEAELEARRRQYEYYRDKLLNFNELGNNKRGGVKHNLLPINELCVISRGRVMSKEYIRDHSGMYPVYSSQTADDGVFGKIDSFDYEGEYLTWTTDGANAGSVFYRSGQFSITNVCGLLKVKTPSVLPQYLFYILKKIAPAYVNSGMGNPKLMSNVMGTIKVPVPSMEEQQRIVSILDRFDALVNDLTSGLPAEIKARRQQYEYYRDKLLTFSQLQG